MNRETLVQKLRDLTGNRFFLATDLDNPEGFHVSTGDLRQMNQTEIKALLNSLDVARWDVTDKGIWFEY